MAEVPRKRHRRTVDTDQFLRGVARMLVAAGNRVAESDEEQLAQLLELQVLLDEVVLSAVGGLRTSGASWDAIGAATGTTRQGAQQRWGARLAQRSANGRATS